MAGVSSEQIARWVAAAGSAGGLGFVVWRIYLFVVEITDRYAARVAELERRLGETEAKLRATEEREGGLRWLLATRGIDVPAHLRRPEERVDNG